MVANKKLIEAVKIVTMGGPVLLNTAGITGTRVSMKGYRRLALVISLAPASGTDVSAVTLKQSKTVADSPSTEKALSFTKMYRQAIATSDLFTETAVVADTFNTSATAVAETFVIEVDETDLDINNGFDCVRVAMSDPGSVSTPATVLALLYQAKFETAPADQISAVVD